MGWEGLRRTPPTVIVVAVTNRDRTVHCRWLTDRFCALPCFYRTHCDHTIPSQDRTYLHSTKAMRYYSVQYLCRIEHHFSLPRHYISQPYQAITRPDHAAQYFMAPHHDWTRPNGTGRHFTSTWPNGTVPLHHKTEWYNTLPRLYNTCPDPTLP